MKYFLHDTNAFQDEKVTELFIEYGYEGLGLFYTILEKIAAQEKPIKTSVLKAQLKVGKKLEKCWSFMENIGLICSSNGETFNKQLLNYAQKYQIKKEKNAKRISEWRDNQQVTENVTHSENVRNTPKVKVSKGNKDILLPPTAENENENFTKFKIWVHDNAPRVMKMKEFFTEESFLRLKEDYHFDYIMDMLRRMHNYKKLYENIDANLTFRNWAKRNPPPQPEQPQVKKMVL